MQKNNVNTTKIYYLAMGFYWLGFGLITIFYPTLMDLFQTENGVNVKTVFSDHVWMHGGFDILAFCILLFALSQVTVSRQMLRATAFAALMPTIAITYSLVSTNYWSPLFCVPAGFLLHKLAAQTNFRKTPMPKSTSTFMPPYFLT